MQLGQVRGDACVDTTNDPESTLGSEEGIRNILERGSCVVFKGAAVKWTTGNSTVTSSQSVDMLQVFSGTKNIEVAVNLVSIRGGSAEPLHYHTSHLIGLVINGEGRLRLAIDASDRSIREEPLAAGDVIVIPQGAFHIFECDDSGKLDYIALEFSDVGIDYQKHWRPGLA